MLSNSVFISWCVLSSGVRTEFLSSAVLALETRPNGVELVDGSIDEVGVVSKDACLEVACAGALHSESGTGEVGGTDVGEFEVEDDNLEVHARAEQAFQTCEEYRVAVEIFAEVRPRLLGMDEAHVTTFAHEVGQHAEEGPLADIEVLDVGCPYPEVFFHFGDSFYYLPEVGFVCDVLGHIYKVSLFQGFQQCGKRIITRKSFFGSLTESGYLCIPDC